jgi:hypothetical protein
MNASTSVPSDRKVLVVTGFGNILYLAQSTELSDRVKTILLGSDSSHPSIHVEDACEVFRERVVGTTIVVTNSEAVIQGIRLQAIREDAESDLTIHFYNRGGLMTEITLTSYGQFTPFPNDFIDTSLKAITEVIRIRQQKKQAQSES